MNSTYNVNFSGISSNRLILRNVFWIMREKSMPVIKLINLELFNDGIKIFTINPDEDEVPCNGLYFENGSIEYEFIHMNTGWFHIIKIESAEINKLDSYTDSDNNYFEGNNLLEMDDLTQEVLNKFTPIIKDAILDVLGFPRLMDPGIITRLVLRNAFYYDTMGNLNDPIYYCNLELFQNGYRIFKADGGTIMRNPDTNFTVRQLIPLTSGEFNALIYKLRLKTNRPDDYPSKYFFLVPNQEAGKLFSTNFEKDLYKLVEDEDLPETDDYYDGQDLSVDRETASQMKLLLSNEVKNEFLEIIRNSH